MRSPGWRFLKTETYRIRVHGRIRRVLNTMTSCLGSRLALPHIRFENATSMDAFILKYGEKNIRFRKYPATCGRGLSIGISSSNL